MRNLSCYLTQPQVVDRSKTVSRRLGWKDAKVGDLLWIVVKAQGLKPGERIERLAAIELTAVRREHLRDITRADVVAEGFPHGDPRKFVAMFCEHMGVSPKDEITRLEWKYREDIWNAYVCEVLQVVKKHQFDLSFPPTEGAITMARKGSKTSNPPTPPPDEAVAKNDKDSIDAAFSQAGPGPGATVTSTKEDPTAPPKTAGAVIPLSGPAQFVTPMEDGENLPPFQQVFTRPMSDHDLAEKLKAAGGLKRERDQVELDMKKSNDGYKKRIAVLDAQINTILANTDSGEKEYTCRKRVDYDRAVVTIFDANTLEILETRQLNLKELQVEMRWAGKVPPGKQGDVIAGPWGGKPIHAEAPKDAPAAAPEGEASAPETTGAASDANPVDGFTLPASEIAKQSGRGRGRPPKPKPPTEPAAPPADEGEGVAAGGIEEAFGGEE